MFFKRRPRLRPSQIYERNSDQLPFLSRSRFSALPKFYLKDKEQEDLTLFIAILYVIDLFGVLPFVTLPALLMQLGIFGIVVIILVVTMQIYTSFLLSQCWLMAGNLDTSITEKSRYPYSAIAELAYGPYVGFFVRILLDLSIFATAIPSLVMAAENLELVGLRISDGHFTFPTFCYWLLVLGLFLCPLIWLRSPKYMRGLAILSVCVVVVIIFLLWFCLFNAHSLGEPFEGIHLGFPTFLNLLNGYSVLAFQFDIHPMLLTLQIDMRRKSQVYWAAFSGLLITCGVAIFTSIVATYKFGTMIAENLVATLPKSGPLIGLLMLIALQLCFSIVVGSSAMFLQIENYFKIPETFSWKRVVLRSTVVAFQILIAEFLPSFDVFADIVGGTITGPLVFILPPLLYRRIRRMRSDQLRAEVMRSTYGSLPVDLNYDPLEMKPLAVSFSQRSAAIATVMQSRQCSIQWGCHPSTSMTVMLFGVLATALSTYMNLFSISDLFRNNSPCFGNITRNLAEWTRK